MSICALDGCRFPPSPFPSISSGFFWLALRSLVGYPSRLTRLFFHFNFSSLLHYSKNKTPLALSVAAKSKPPGTGGRRIEMSTMARSYLTCLGKVGCRGRFRVESCRFPPFLMVLLVLHLLQFLYLRREREREREKERKKEKEHGGTAGSDRSFGVLIWTRLLLLDGLPLLLFLWGN
jgi:hypothetical protein